MRKALAIIGIVQVLVALAPSLAQAAGPMGMAPSRGQSHQFNQSPQFNRSNQFNQNPQFSRFNRSFQGHPNFNRSRFHRPYYYRPYYYFPYYPYYSSYSSSNYSDYSAAPSYAPQQNYNYSGAPSGYGAPQSYLDIAPAPQIEREVFFPEGRYVLLGDGDAAPFRWVWVPNPPTAPPADTQGQR